MPQSNYPSNSNVNQYLGQYTCSNGCYTKNKWNKIDWAGIMIRGEILDTIYQVCHFVLYLFTYQLGPAIP